MLNLLILAVVLLTIILLFKYSNRIDLIIKYHIYSQLEVLTESSTQIIFHKHLINPVIYDKVLKKYYIGKTIKSEKEWEKYFKKNRLNINDLLRSKDFNRSLKLVKNGKNI